ncbi:hypothetical protein [Eisenbergiella porci]|uniref:hypothetical protein n=1 Tax=Eisenbergiella porci TaxID=2652274 RepID=UPI002A832DFF|nr:hypothetical protein [Eisenbergiella porci]
MGKMYRVDLSKVESYARRYEIESLFSVSWETYVHITAPDPFHRVIDYFNVFDPTDLPPHFPEVPDPITITEI